MGSVAVLAGTHTADRLERRMKDKSMAAAQEQRRAGPGGG